MREPSIHITKSSFRKILKEMDIKFPVEDFFVRARQFSIDTRSITITSRKTNKKINNITLASNGDANLAADILYSVQIHLKHRGVKKIDESNTRFWPLCKKLADVCNTFCHDFGLETRAGYIKYIRMGFSRMDNNRNYLNRLISMAQNITESYQATQEINNDKSPIETASIHDYYCSEIISRTGIKVDYGDKPETYIYFVKVREFCESEGIDPEDWIEAQFFGLEWCNGIPDPDKLLKGKCKEYYAKYMYKNNKNFDQTPKVKGSLWSQINDDDE